MKRSPHGFYRKDNLRRLWNQIRRGEGPQSCHLSDPSHPDHVTAGAAPSATTHECPGSIALVAREIETLQQLNGNVKAYRSASPTGLAQGGIMYWVARISLGHTPFCGPPVPPIEAQLVLDKSLCGCLHPAATSDQPQRHDR